jgi:hypothetical protein
MTCILYNIHCDQSISLRREKNLDAEESGGIFDGGLFEFRTA